RVYREQEVAILRTLGANSRLLLPAVAMEYLAFGLISGLAGVVVGYSGSAAILYFVSGHFVIISDLIAILGIMITVGLLTTAIGVFGQRAVLRRKPFDVLRRQ